MPKAKTAYGPSAPIDTSYLSNPGLVTKKTYADASVTYADTAIKYIGRATTYNEQSGKTATSFRETEKGDTAFTLLQKTDTDFGKAQKNETVYNLTTRIGTYDDTAIGYDDTGVLYVGDTTTSGSNEKPKTEYS